MKLVPNRSLKGCFCSPHSNSHLPYSKQAFTIVELLVVIVVIAILAAITIVSFTGISQKAIVASIQSDLNNNTNLLKMYYTEYSSYPIIPANSTSMCPTAPVVDNKYCLKPSSGNIFTYTPTVGVNSQSFTLTTRNTAVTNKYYTSNNNSSSEIFSSNWIAGLTGTDLANKWVYNVDLANTSCGDLKRHWQVLRG